ncbi:hypothetical protein SNE40_001898 [Patella caerulea]|uniref:BTB domain-containing protein n=1 Tax=Patella caerulea TaxID=87958 RepID=A0AAN8K523_PATCE
MPFLTSRDQHSSELPVTDLTVDTTERVTLNIGGKRFVTSKFSLLNIPTTKLGKLSKSDPSYDPKNDEYFFDRNPKIVQCILDLHRTGDLHLPGNVCSTGVKAELEFWNVPEDYIAECCWKTYSLQNQDLKIAAIIDQQMGQNESQETNPSKPSIREKLWLTMEQPSHSFNAKVGTVISLEYFVRA